MPSNDLCRADVENAATTPRIETDIAHGRRACSHVVRHWPAACYLQGKVQLIGGCCWFCYVFGLCLVFFFGSVSVTGIGLICRFCTQAWPGLRAPISH